ncbi:unnamed protein product [Amoebophrya sp. A120]|nr:unnamed protein product [Amoebophrya sp. A120]|eukprot:GSA120T00002941001.1
MRLVPAAHPSYRAARESKGWHWLLPKALANATTGNDVLNAFLRFRHKQPKKVHHYLKAMTRLTQVGGCDIADWRFKYIASRLKPLRFRIVNLPRLALMYAKLNAVKEVKELTRFLFAKLDWYSMQQLAFLVRAFAMVKLNDSFLLQAVIRRVLDSLEFHHAATQSMCDVEAILPLNVDGLLTPSGPESGLWEKIRDHPNYRHEAYKGASRYKYETYHYGKEYTRWYQLPDESEADYERRLRYLVNNRHYTETRDFNPVAEITYRGRRSSQKHRAALIASEGTGRESRRGVKLLAEDCEESPLRGSSGREQASSPTSKALALVNHSQNNGEDDKFLEETEFEEGTPQTKLSKAEHGGTEDSFSSAFLEKSNRRFHDHKPRVAPSERDFSQEEHASTPSPDAHDYLRPPTLEELLQIIEGCAALEFRHYEFCGAVAQEFLLAVAGQNFSGEEDTLSEQTGTYGNGDFERTRSGDNRDPLILLHGSRLALSFARIEYRDYSFFTALSDLLTRRLVDPALAASIRLTPGIMIDVLRAFRVLRINDPVLMQLCGTHIKQYLHEYPARELAYLCYITNELPAKVARTLLREYECLDLNSAAALAGVVADLKCKRRMLMSTSVSDNHVAEPNTSVKTSLDSDEETAAVFGATSAAGAKKVHASNYSSTTSAPSEHFASLHVHDASLASDAQLDALQESITTLLTTHHARESRERYEIGKMMEALTLTEDNSANFPLFHVFCRHLHRHMQFLESTDYLRVLAALDRFQCWDARVVTALAKWLRKRKTEFAGKEWSRAQSLLANLEARGM